MTFEDAKPDGVVQLTIKEFCDLVAERDVWRWRVTALLDVIEKADALAKSAEALRLRGDDYPVLFSDVDAYRAARAALGKAKP